MITKRNLVNHKRRFDRGGNYVNYLTMFFTGGTFVRVFGITNPLVYLLGVIALIGYRYITGYVEEKKGILQEEQKRYAELNPEWKELIVKIDKLIRQNEK